MAHDTQPLNKTSESSQTGDGEPLPRRRTCTGYHTYKILTIVYAVFYVLVGLLLLGLGIWIAVVKKDYESITDIVTGPAALCIVVGLIIVVSAKVGCVGAITNRLWPLRIFLAIVVIVFIFQVVIGILGYVYREEAIENIGGRLRTTIEGYHLNTNIEYAIDRIQRKGSCCGFKNYDDWESSPLYSCAASSPGRCSVPDSCCQAEKENCGLNARERGQINKINTRGCETSLLNWIEQHLDVLGGTALGLAIIHILGMFVVYVLITKIEDRIRLFRYRKRFFQS